MKRKRSDEKNEPEGRTRAPSGAAVMQQSVTEALTKAFFAEWARVGYGALSLEAVAARAGVGKAALYRRWPSKLAMAKDRLETIGIGLAVATDTGSLDGDIRAILGSVRRILRHPLVRRILPDLHAEMLRNPDLARAVRGRLQTERRQRAEVIIRRAITREEIGPNVDLELVNDALGGLVYWRMIVTDGRADRAYIDRLAAFIGAAIQAG